MFKKIYLSLIMVSLCSVANAQSLNETYTGSGIVPLGAIPGPSDILWDNTAITVGTSGLVSIQGNNLTAGADRTNSADDFIVPTGEVWNVEFVFSTGFNTGTVDPDNFGVVFYADAGGIPGAVIAEEQIVFGGVVNNTDQELTLASPVSLPAGTYWVSVYASYDNFIDLTTNRWNWFFGSSPIGADNVIQDTIGLFGGITWSSCASLGVADCFSYNFALRGTSAPAVISAPPTPVPSLTWLGLALMVLTLGFFGRRFVK